MLIPYIGGLSEAIQRFLAEVDIRVVFRPFSTLRQQLVHPKDDTPTTKKSNVVYSIPCTTCPAVYIGQTSRTLNTGINEHKTAVKHARTEVSAVAEHDWQEKHQMDFQKTCILAHEPNLHQRRFLESWHIQKQHTINREIGSLAPVYSSLFYIFMCILLSVSLPNHTGMCSLVLHSFITSLSLSAFHVP